MLPNTNKNMSIKYFDTLQYVQQSKKIKDQGALAEHQAKQIEDALETAVQYVKKDYTSQIENLRGEMHGQDLASKEDLFSVQRTLKADITSVQQALKADITSVERVLKAEFKAETAEGKSELKTEMAEFKTELKTEMAELKTELKTEMAELRTELKTEISEVKVDISNLRHDTLKFVIWTGAAIVTSFVSTIAGAIFVIAKNLHHWI